MRGDATKNMLLAVRNSSNFLSDTAQNQSLFSPVMVSIDASTSFQQLPIRCVQLNMDSYAQTISID